MKLKKFVYFFLRSDGLAHFKRNKAANDIVTKKYTQGKRDDTGGDTAKRLILEDIGQFRKKTFAVGEVLKYPVKHWGLGGKLIDYFFHDSRAAAFDENEIARSGMLAQPRGGG